MSVATMTRLAVEAEAERVSARPPALEWGGPGVPPPAPQPPATQPGTVSGAAITAASDPRSGTQAALEAIAAYIPSEALAVYIAALGLFQPGTAGDRWFWFVVGVALVIGFGALSAMDRVVRPSMRTFAVLTIMAVVSFATYAGALPASPFLALHPQATLGSGLVALILSAALPRIARIAGVAPRT